MKRRKSSRSEMLAGLTHRGLRTWAALIIGSTVAVVGCGERVSSVGEEIIRSPVVVSLDRDGTVHLKTTTAEFEILPSGYLRAYLLKNGRRLTLDDPPADTAASSDYVLSAGKEVRDFQVDLNHLQISDAGGNIGRRGKKVVLKGRNPLGSGPQIEKTLEVEVYDDFPELALTKASYKNIGLKDIHLDAVIAQRHRLSAALVDPKASPYSVWSFQGSSHQQGKDEVVAISKGFSQPNLMGSQTANGVGGGIPVVAFWTKSVAEAIGHVEPLPLVLSLPVSVEADHRISTSVVFGPNTTLKPGETFSTPRCFVAVYAGDFYEALRLWSNVLQRQGWTLPQPSEEAYQVSWSAWGYESDVKRAQLLGTIPKLKELNIKWGAVDYCWFDHFGDWNPRPDIFPGNSIREVVDEFHKQGVRVALWWRPMAVEDGPGQLFTHRYAVARIVRQHPNWLILDKNGKPAQIRDGLAAFCPALREVQDYHKKLTEKFIRDWGFDGNKLDMVYSLPPCYNPTHHHKSPEESIYAMAEVFKVIFQTTRQLKPDGVTQTCPCGTMPNLAWLPYMDQAVTADPLGSVQMRRRIKVYKGLLGPEAAVYADHIELSEMKLANGEWAYLGKDFASTVGVGGVIGTKFVWPEAEPRFRSVLLTPEKYSLWKKWIGIYQDKMPSRGTFLNLYVHAYDVPEGYAIEKDGNMYYAFFAPQASREWKGGPQNGAENFTFHTPQPPTGWKGELELRGLEQGRYRVLDYENGSVLGTVEGPNPKLLAAFSEHLLLEVSKVK